MKNKLCGSCLTLLGLLFFGQAAIAQIYQPSNRTPVADRSVNTQVLPSGNNFDITGGLSKGQALFHSFTDFSIPTNGRANFINPVGTRDVITRVTGNSFSDLNGTLNSNGTNFFLINPNGIIFGNNVRLDVGRSFIGSTANSIDLIDSSGRGITFGTNLNGDALLRIAPNVPFNVSRLNIGSGSGSISNYGTLQTTNNGQYIGLIGGNINLDRGKIIAPSGRVDLGGISTNGTAVITSDGLVFNGTGLVRSNVLITNGAIVSVRTNTGLVLADPIFFAGASSPGSSINIVANQIDLISKATPFDGSNDQGIINRINNFVAELDAGLGINTGQQAGVVGDISLKSTGDITLKGSAIFNTARSASQANGGSIKIAGDGNLIITDRSGISTSFSSNTIGKTGDIDINVKGNVILSESIVPDPKTSGGSAASGISSGTYARGDTGVIKIVAKGKLLVGNLDSIVNSIQGLGTGTSGGIQIDVGELELINQGNILSFALPSTNPGNAGPININAKGNITIIGTENTNIIRRDNAEARNINNLNPLSRISSNTFRQGNPGKISISTPGKLLLLNRGEISAAIRNGGSGTAGEIKLDVGEIEIRNQSRIVTRTEAGGTGNATNINIRTSGDIKINGSDDKSLVLRNDLNPLSFIDSATNGKGNAGKVSIDAKGIISISNRGAISTNSTSTDNGSSGGNISINAQQLNLDRSKISLDATNDTGGNITLNTQNWILMRNTSTISTNSDSKGKNGNGGNIAIDSPLIITLPGNNDITANANAGSGGTVKITSQGLFGIQYRLGKSSPFTNDITVSSIQGSSGIVNIKTPGIDPGKDSTELPNVPSDASNQISQVCSAETRQNKFTVTGRGGLPPNANDPLTGDVVWQDARAVSPQPAVTRTIYPTPLTPPAIGWVMSKGKVTLIAAGAESQATRTSVVCPASK